MMHGHEKSRSAIVAVKPTNKAERSAAESVERRAETEGNVDQQRTRRTQRRISVSQMLARILQHIVAVDTRGGNRMRESCTYGSVWGGARSLASLPRRARQSWCDPAGASPAQVRSSVRLVASVAGPLATAVAKRTQRLHGISRRTLGGVSRLSGQRGNGTK
jgi:hypothetical protein